MNFIAFRLTFALCSFCTVLLAGCDFSLSGPATDFRPLAAAALAVHGVDDSPFAPVPTIVPMPVPKSTPTTGSAPTKQPTPNVKLESQSTKPPVAASRRTGTSEGISPAPAARSTAVSAPANACGPNGCAVGGVRAAPRVFGRFR